MTVFGAISVTGMVAAMTIEEATGADIFRAYIERVLCPKPKPRDVVVGDAVAMDNLSSHKARGMRESIQSRGAELLYPPLS